MGLGQDSPTTHLHMQFLSNHSPIHTLIHLSIHLFIHQSTHPIIHSSIHPFTHPPICLPIHPSIHLPTHCPSTPPSIHLPIVHPSNPLPTHPPIYLTHSQSTPHLSTYPLSIPLTPIHPSTHPFLSPPSSNSLLEGTEGTLNLRIHCSSGRTTEVCKDFNPEEDTQGSPKALRNTFLEIRRV